MFRHLLSRRPVATGAFATRGHASVRCVRRAGLPLSLAAVGAVFGGIYLLDARSSFHEYVLCPLIRLSTDAETGHRLGILFMKYGLCPRDLSYRKRPELQVDVFGTTLDSPIGVAAGLDKDAEAVEALFNTGFAYVEVGSVTPLPQPGNPRPRFFRLPRDDAVINRYGFNSAGHFQVLANLKMRLARCLRPESSSFALRDGRLLAVNLGKNKTGDEVGDYVQGVRRLGPYADVLVVNVLSPNTPGLRDLQSEAKLAGLLLTLVGERDALAPNRFGKRPPVLVKIAPDLSEPELASVASAAKQARVDGVIVSNTTVQRPTSLLSDAALVAEAGGLSGKPVKPYALRALRTLHAHTKGSGLVLVGCGGIASGKDVLEFGKAGASFVQVYTAYAYKGPGLPGKLRDELAAELARENKTWAEIVGSEGT